MKIKLIAYISIILFLYSCQSLKDGLTGKKKNNSDEFLVEKKNPLEIPPEFSDLPVPKAEEDSNENAATEDEIQNLIKSVKKNKTTKSTNKSAEEFVINEINKN